jgi:hypothetical protein
MTRRGSGPRIAGEPPVHVEVVILLAPHQSRDRGPDQGRLVGGRPGRHEVGEELVGLGGSRGHHLSESVAQIELLGVRRSEPQPDRRLAAGRHRQHVVQRRFGPRTGGIDGCGPGHDVVVDGVFGIGRPTFQPPQALRIVLVVTGKADGRRRDRVAGQHEAPDGVVSSDEAAVPGGGDRRNGVPAGQPPGPGIAEP